MEAFVSALAGIAIGGLITFFVSRYYFRRGADELERVANKQARVVALLALYMQRDGLLEDVELDEKGHLKEGYKQTLKGGGIPSQAQAGGGTLVQGPPPTPEAPQTTAEGE